MSFGKKWSILDDVRVYNVTSAHAKTKSLFNNSTSQMQIQSQMNFKKLQSNDFLKSNNKNESQIIEQSQQQQYIQKLQISIKNNDSEKFEVPTTDFDFEVEISKKLTQQQDDDILKFKVQTFNPNEHQKLSQNQQFKKQIAQFNKNDIDKFQIQTGTQQIKQQFNKCKVNYEFDDDSKFNLQQIIFLANQFNKQAVFEVNDYNKFQISEIIQNTRQKQNFEIQLIKQNNQQENKFTLNQNTTHLTKQDFKKQYIKQNNQQFKFNVPILNTSKSHQQTFSKLLVNLIQNELKFTVNIPQINQIKQNFNKKLTIQQNNDNKFKINCQQINNQFFKKQIVQKYSINSRFVVINELQQ